MKTLLWIIIILLLAAGVYWILSDNTVPVSNTYTTSNNSTDNTNNVSTTTINLQNSTTTVVTSSPKTVTVSYTNSGFSPKSIEISLGDTVRFVNNSSQSMWVASAAHPIHSAYDGTTLQQHCAPGSADSFDQCKAGTSYSFTFTKVGTWNYHNHSDSTDFGTVVVR